MIEELFLSGGRPLVRWKAKGGLEEVYRWLDEGRDPEAFIDLEVSLTEAMGLADIQRLRKSRDGIVHIRPVYPEMEALELESERSRRRRTCSESSTSGKPAGRSPRIIWSICFWSLLRKRRLTGRR